MSNPSGSNWTTNVNRAKTKRWIEAKSYSYDGDDWGDADEYGEYDEPKPAAKATGLRKATPAAAAAAAAAAASNAASSTGRERANSFGQDDERRAFSGPMRTAYAQPQITQPQMAFNPSEQSSAAQRPQNTSQTGTNPQGGQGLNAQVPHDNRTASMTSNNDALAPVGGRRKPSIGQTDQPTTLPVITTDIPSPPPTIGTPEKPGTPTIIRPADIYRRIQEEREKERLSQESSRPSLSGLIRDQSPAGKSDASGTKQQSQGTTSVIAPNTLDPNAEASRAKGPIHSSVLPEIGGLSGFGDEFGGSFMSSGTEPIKKTISESTAKPADSQPNPSGSVSREQIQPDTQPQLHHQPSLGYTSVVNQAFDQAVPPTPSSASGSVLDRSNSDSTTNISPIISREVSNAVRPNGMNNIDTITEEPAGSSRPGTSGSGTKRQSGTEASTIKLGHRRDASLPSSNNSPAKVLALESTAQLQKPQEAEIAVTTPVDSIGGRERSASPSKSRVRDLVEKLDSANNSRRNSQASLGDKVDASQSPRPQILAAETYRPSIPGAWASYTTNPIPEQRSISPERKDENSNEAAESDNNPSTSKDEAFSKAAAAGSALAGALIAGIGTVAGVSADSKENEQQSPIKASKVDTAFHPEAARLALPRNDSENTASSIMPTPNDMESGSYEESQYFNTVKPLQHNSDAPSNTLIVPQVRTTQPADDMSTHSSPTDLESDRLRKEIVRELSPQRDETETVTESKQESVQGETANTYSSIYDSYMDEEDEADKSVQLMEVSQPAALSPRPARDSQPPVFSSTSGPLEDLPESSAATEVKPDLNRQFSWEAPVEQLNTPSKDSKAIVENTEAALVESDHSRSVVEKPKTVPEEQSLLSKPTIDYHETSPVVSTIEESTSYNEQKHPSLSKLSLAHESTDTLQPGHQPQTQQTQQLQQTQSQQKVPAFREIMAIQSAQQRIQTYDQTRNTFANTDTGLLQWIQTTITALPEHEELLKNGGSFPAVVRPATAAVAGQSSLGMSSTSRPSFGPTPGKSVKGKDVLHTAGVFGAKAGGAAKGLFAKGKSKWGRGGDKGFKRFRGLSVNSNNNEPASNHPPQNLWETDVTVPSFVEQSTIHKTASKSSMAGLLDPWIQQANASHRDDTRHSNTISPPTTAAPDSPTLGRSFTLTGSVVSPMSVQASHVRKRASMEALGSVRHRHRGHRPTSSVDSHRYGVRARGSFERRQASGELKSRLTVHQAQMRNFGEEFPMDLIIPAAYRVPTDSDVKAKVVSDTSAEQTPTQASFPKEITRDVPNPAPIAEAEFKKSERKAAPSALWLDTTGGSSKPAFNGPASPDYILQPREDIEPTKNGDLEGKRPEVEKHFSTLSFIQFDSVASEDLALNNPITPRRISFSRGRSNTDESSRQQTQASQSSFADYPAAEDFGALPYDPSVSSPSRTYDRSSSMNSYSQQHPATDTIRRRPSRGSTSTKSRSSMLLNAVKRLSRHNLDAMVDNPAMSHHEDHQNKDTRQQALSNNNKRRSMMRGTQEAPENEHALDARGRLKQKRKSSHGLGLTFKPADTVPAETTKPSKFSLVPSVRKRAGTDLTVYGADSSRPSLTPDKNNAAIRRNASVKIGLDSNLSNKATPERSGGKRRFSGFNSLINKAKPRIEAMSNVARGRSPIPAEGVVQSKLESTPEYEQIHPSSRPRGIQKVETDQAPLNSTSDGHAGSSTQDISGATSLPIRNPGETPAAHIRNAASIPDISSNRDAFISKLTSAPEEGPDYKSVYPPEFFGEQPPEGYYEPEEPIYPGSNPTPAPAVSASAPATTTPPMQHNRASTGPARGLRKPSGPRAMAIAKTDVAGENDQPPPPPPKDYPNQSNTMTTTASHTFKKPANLSVETGTETSQQTEASRQPETSQQSEISTEQTETSQKEHSLPSSRGSEFSTITVDPVFTSNIIPPSGTPIVETAVTKTVTRIASVNSLSASPSIRSSMLVSPLHIKKKSPSSAGEEFRSVNGSVSTQSSPDPSTNNQQGSTTPYLTVNTQVKPNTSPPVGKMPEKPAIGLGVGSEVLGKGATKVRAHPFVAKRAPSAQEENSPGARTRGEILNSVMSASMQPETPSTASTLNDGKPESTPPGHSPPKAASIPALMIRKSPELVTQPSLDSTSRRERQKVAPPPLPIPKSVYSPGLVDSPTLPQPTPPPPSTPAAIPNPATSTQPATTTSKDTDKEIAPTAGSPAAVKQPPPTVRSMTPVEKMKDEPKVAEATREEQSEESEDEIVMSSTAYPGQEWRPDYGYGGWDGYE